MGRPLYYEEIVKMRAAERVISAYRAKFGGDNWAEWAKKNPKEDEFLNIAMQLAGEYGWS